MSRKHRILMTRLILPVSAALLLGGCIITAQGGGRIGGPPYGPAYGHHVDFIDYHGPVFGHRGTFTFVLHRPGHYRIVAHDGVLLGFAILELGYRVRITDTFGATLYWYYREPTGVFHVIGPGRDHMGYIDPRHRHFRTIKKFTDPHVRSMHHKDIDADRKKLGKKPKKKPDR